MLALAGSIGIAWEAISFESAAVCGVELFVVIAGAGYSGCSMPCAIHISELKPYAKRRSNHDLHGEVSATRSSILHKAARAGARAVREK